MRSADAARPRPDGVAVSPAIGPLPAIIVPVFIEEQFDPIETPQVRVQAAIPHRKPTDKTVLPGIRRYGC